MNSVLDKETASLLINIAQILDVVKLEWGESWSEFDQAIRDDISKRLREYYITSKNNNVEMLNV